MTIDISILRHIVEIARVLYKDTPEDIPVYTNEELDNVVSCYNRVIYNYDTDLYLKLAALIIGMNTHLSIKWQ